MPPSIVYKDRQNKHAGAFFFFFLLMCLPLSPNEHTGDSLDADGCVFVLHTWGVLICHRLQTRRASYSQFNVHLVIVPFGFYHLSLHCLQRVDSTGPTAALLLLLLQLHLITTHGSKPHSVI